MHAILPSSISSLRSPSTTHSSVSSQSMSFAVPHASTANDHVIRTRSKTAWFGRKTYPAISLRSLRLEGPISLAVWLCFRTAEPRQNPLQQAMRAHHPISSSFSLMTVIGLQAKCRTGVNAPSLPATASFRWDLRRRLPTKNVRTAFDLPPPPVLGNFLCCCFF